MSTGLCTPANVSTLAPVRGRVCLSVCVCRMQTAVCLGTASGVAIRVRAGGRGVSVNPESQSGGD